MSITPIEVELLRHALAYLAPGARIVAMPGVDDGPGTVGGATGAGLEGERAAGPLGMNSPPGPMVPPMSLSIPARPGDGPVPIPRP